MEDTKIVFIVTSGEYSDYRINGVFENEEDAKAYARKLDSGYEEAMVERWILNRPGVSASLKLYEVKMDVYGNAEVKPPETNRVGEAFISSFRNVKYLVVTVYAKDEQHAAKIANEMRAKLIAANEWK